MVTYADMKAQIKQHEGYRDSIYIDSVGVPTGGYGHAFINDSKLPQRIWEEIFEIDFMNCLDDYQSLQLDLDPAREGVIINMLFNLGRTKFLKFTKLIDALRKKDFSKAASEIRSSRWYNQVGVRGEDLASIMDTMRNPSDEQLRFPKIL